MNGEDVSRLVKAAKAKSALLEGDFLKYFLRAVMAGFFIDVAMIFSNVVSNLFRGSAPEWGKLMGALVFSIAVLLIVMVGGELFTGNNLVMAFSAYGGDVSWWEVIKVWVVSYLGNFVGCAFMGALFVWAGASGTADYYASFIPGKLAVPAGPLFCRAVLCNFFVCLAVLCGIKLQNEVAKILMICICITGFVVSGFEHSIANMGNFTVAFFLVPGMSLTAVLRSMLYVTLGNVVGGGVLLALPLRLMSAEK